MIKILFLASNPPDTDRLRLDEEVREIERRLQGFFYLDELTFVTAWAVQAYDVVFLLDRHRPTLLHLSGHGSEEQGYILDDGNTIDGQKLAELLSVVGGAVEGVILNYCKSATQADRLSQYVRHVIFTTTAVSDASAIEFSALFYLAVAYGNDPSEAFKRAKLSLKLANCLDWNSWSIITNDEMAGWSPANKSRLLNYMRGRDGRRERARRISSYELNLSNDREFIDMIARFRVKPLVKDYKGISEAIDDIGGEFVRLTGGVGFIIIDVDDLTLINGRYGYEIGNAVLNEILAMTTSIFENGLVSRCGDDTIMIILGSALQNEIEKSAANLCETIKAHDWSLLHDGLFVSCSGGYSQRRNMESIVDAFIRAAIGMSDGKRIAKGFAHSAPVYLSSRFTKERIDRYGIFSGAWETGKVGTMSVFEF